MVKWAPGWSLAGWDGVAQPRLHAAVPGEPGCFRRSIQSWTAGAGKESRFLVTPPARRAENDPNAAITKGPDSPSRARLCWRPQFQL